jgi:hypothetical protein
VASIAKAVSDLKNIVSQAPSDMSDSYLEVARLSSDLVTLSGFDGQIVEDLISALIDIAGHTTNMRRDIFLHHLCPALLPRAAVFLRASKYLGPKLFEPGLILMAQNNIEKRKAQKQQSSLVSSYDSGQGCCQMTLGWTAKPGQEAVSKPLASGKAVDTNGKRKPYFPPPLRLRARENVRARRLKSS